MESGPEYIREFISNRYIDGEKWPRLDYYEVHDTTKIKDSTNICDNATIFNYFPQTANIYDIARDNRDLIVASGVTAQTILTFPQIDSLPKNILLYKVDLVFDVTDKDLIDQSEPNPLDNPNHAEEYYIRNILERDNELENIVVDSSYYSNSLYNILMTQSGDSVHLSDYQQQNFARIILQPIVNGDKNTEGFLIKYRNEVQDISVKRFNNTAISKPRLRLQYYLLEKTGY